MVNLKQQIQAYKEQHMSTDFDIQQRVIDEAFIRRVAYLHLPLMLKESFVTRQYLPVSLKNYRLCADLDWFGLDQLDEVKLNQWMTLATNCTLDDGIQFSDFRENSFWRRIDYAMADDFPTVNTDIGAYFIESSDEGKLTQEGFFEYGLYAMDISFNIKLLTPPIPLTYTPLIGEPFVVPFSCPLDIQVAWKLHQCIVAPRFKDMIDLIWLLSEKPTINWPIVFQSITEECKRDKPKRSHIGYLHYLRNHRLAEHPYFSAFNNILNPLWNLWRNHDNDYFQQASKLYGQAAINKLRWGQGGIKRSFTENAPIPIHLTELLEQLHHALDIPEFTQFLSTLSEKSGIIQRILNTFRT